MQILRKYIYGGHVGEYMEEMIVSRQILLIDSLVGKQWGAGEGRWAHCRQLLGLHQTQGRMVDLWGQSACLPIQ